MLLAIEKHNKCCTIFSVFLFSVSKLCVHTFKELRQCFFFHTFITYFIHVSVITFFHTFLINIFFLQADVPSNEISPHWSRPQGESKHRLWHLLAPCSRPSFYLQYMFLPHFLIAGHFFAKFYL